MDVNSYTNMTCSSDTLVASVNHSMNRMNPSPIVSSIYFIGSKCTRGIGDWDDYYSEACEHQSKEQIDSSNFISFVYEGNGAPTMYDSHTTEVFLFSHDHSFDNVEFMENQPEYTFHTFKGIKTFVQYVEEIAIQWNEILR